MHVHACRLHRRLLHACLVLAGPSATPCLPSLLPALVAAMGDDEGDIVARLAACCRLVGVFCPPASWLPLATDAVADPKAGPASKANALVVLACMVRAAAAAGQGADAQLVAQLVAALASEDVRAADHAGVQVQLLAVVTNLLAWMPQPALQASSQALYLILLQLHGSSRGGGGGGGADSVVAGSRAATPEPGGGSVGGTAAAAAVMQLLAQRTGMAGPGQLAQQHAAQLLPRLTGDAGSWTAGSSHLAAFTSLLRTADAGCLEELLPQVAQVRA